jgi:large subunit ribosomal protein L13
MSKHMEKTTTTVEYTIDASGKRLGKVATEAASYLLGKNTTSQARNTTSAVTVHIVNASKLDITLKKMEEIYQTYSGYPGGRKVETAAHLGTRRGYGEVVRRTVKGMLPKNKLQTIRMKNLKVTE